MKPLDLSKPYEEALAVFLSTHPYRDVCIDGAEYHYLLCGKGETTLVFLVGGMGLSYYTCHTYWRWNQIIRY